MNPIRRIEVKKIAVPHYEAAKRFGLIPVTSRRFLLNMQRWDPGRLFKLAIAE